MTNQTDIPKGYKQTKVGVVPEDWVTNTVGKALVIENNKRKPISELERRQIQGVYPYYGPTKIQDYLNEYHYDGEYALIAEDGDHFLKYRDQSMTQLVSGKFNVNNHAHALKGTDECLTKWFFWFYNRKSVYSHITRQGAGRYKLNKAALEQLYIAYPEIPEQIEIIKTLETWDKSISTTQSIIDELKLRNKGLAQQLLTGKKRLKGFDKKWRNIQIKDIADQQNIYNKEDLELEVLSCTKYDGLVRSLDYFGRQVFGNDLSKYKIVPNGSFAYATNHIEEGSIGYQNLLEKGLTSPMYTVFKTKESVDDNFLFRLLKTDRLIYAYQSNMSGSINRRGGLRWKDFSTIHLRFPDKIEQTAIDQLLTDADQELKIYTKKLSTLKEQKKGLMQKLLTGEIRVNTNKE